MATTDQTVSGVPGRYASALFNLASDENAIDKVGADLASFQAALDDSADLRRLVASPVFKASDQVSAFEAVCAKGKVGGMALNFIRLAARNRRLSALPAMIKAYTALVAAAKGEISAEVVSAEKLSVQQLKDLKIALKDSIGRDVTLSDRKSVV